MKADDSMNVEFRICPACSSKSLKTENGCDHVWTVVIVNVINN